MLDSEFEDEREPRRVRPTRRDHRSRRIDVMREMESGVVDERPIKERFSREFKNPRLKKIKDPLEKIREKVSLMSAEHIYQYIKNAPGTQYIPGASGR